MTTSHDAFLRSAEEIAVSLMAPHVRAVYEARLPSAVEVIAAVFLSPATTWQHSQVCLSRDRKSVHRNSAGCFLSTTVTFSLALSLDWSVCCMQRSSRLCMPVTLSALCPGCSAAGVRGGCAASPVEAAPRRGFRLGRTAGEAITCHAIWRCTQGLCPWTAVRAESADCVN